jgi:predicted acylesterase/phospholipase RssA
MPPPELGLAGQIPGMSNVRFWGDEQIPFYYDWIELSDAEIAAAYSSIMDTEHNYITISGGGARGAYGAGLLVGSTEFGDRPEFTLVTGISTGSLIAPFAFLGAEYDHVLEAMYTQYSTKDILKQRGKLAILMNDAIADSAPMMELIAEYVTQEVLDKIAIEYLKGRDLLIGTTNLDAGRPVIWDIGRIATSGSPDALALVHQVIVASASIPGVFPPVMIEVEAGGQRFDEMHVDGGTTNQVFLYPTQFDFDLFVDRLRVKGRPNVYVLRNALLTPRWKGVERKVSSIAGRTIDTLLRTQGLGDLYRIYLQTLEDRLNFYLTYIPEDFTMEAKEPFDQEYMQVLFEIGRNRGRTGTGWVTVPPGYEEKKLLRSEDN